MRAGVCYEFGKSLIIKEIDIGQHQMREVMAKNSACAICHSDIHGIRGDWGGRIWSLACYS